MSGYLDQKLAGLKINGPEAKQTPKKVGPAVPPKPKKPQPQVPKSYAVNGPCEPSFASPLQCTSPEKKLMPTPIYSNVSGFTSKEEGVNNTYSNAEMLKGGGGLYRKAGPQTPLCSNANVAPNSITSSNADMLKAGGGLYRKAGPQTPLCSNVNVVPNSITSSNADMLKAGGGLYRKAGPQTPLCSNVNVAPNNITSSNADMLKAGGGLYRKAGPQTPLYSNVSLAPNSSSNSNYSNVPSYANIDDIPPMPEMVDYSDLPAHFPPPPSPVSSSYSELGRATNSNSLPHYASYPPSSQGGSGYDSIYEPIAPRPPSPLSSTPTSYSLYPPYKSLSHHNHLPSHEAQVDALTDLLVSSMDSPTTDAYIYGDCCKCGEKVVGEDNGCTAMDQVYHIECFTCCHCAVQLRGKPFYTLEGKPYCEAGYLLSLEKCSVCQSPILERILRATGRPYHPHCFCCLVCGKSLDGIPFTVDATNQIHCIEDFHKKFAPRCCVCQQPIMPEPGQDETVRVVALDRSFHISCYKCEDCGLLLSSETEGRGCYPLDDHVLCKSCNAKRVQALTSHMTTEL